MAAETEPRSGLVVGYDFGESGWDLQIEATFRAIARLKMGGGILDRDILDPIALTPSDGDAYIVGTPAAGDWLGLEDQIAVWDNTAGEWVYYTVPDGFGIFILDEEVYSVYKTGSGWSDGTLHVWT